MHVLNPSINETHLIPGLFSFSDRKPINAILIYGVVRYKLIPHVKRNIWCPIALLWWKYKLQGLIEMSFLSYARREL